MPIAIPAPMFPDTDPQSNPNTIPAPLPRLRPITSACEPTSFSPSGSGILSLILKARILIGLSGDSSMTPNSQICDRLSRYNTTTWRISPKASSSKQSKYQNFHKFSPIYLGVIYLHPLDTSASSSFHPDKDTSALLLRWKGGAALRTTHRCSESYSDTVLLQENRRGLSLLDSPIYPLP